MKANKGLTDRELVGKYEAGSINLADVLKKVAEPAPPKGGIKSKKSNK